MDQCRPGLGDDDASSRRAVHQVFPDGIRDSSFQIRQMGTEETHRFFCPDVTHGGRFPRHVSFDGVRQGIDSRIYRDGCTDAFRKGRIRIGEYRENKRRIYRLFRPGGGIGQHADFCHFTSRSGRGRYGHNRQRADIRTGKQGFVVEIIRTQESNDFGGIHGRSAADSNDKIDMFRFAKSSCRTDCFYGRIVFYLVKQYPRHTG